MQASRRDLHSALRIVLFVFHRYVHMYVSMCLENYLTIKSRFVISNLVHFCIVEKSKKQPQPRKAGKATRVRRISPSSFTRLKVKNDASKRLNNRASSFPLLSHLYMASDLRTFCGLGEEWGVGRNLWRVSWVLTNPL